MSQALPGLILNEQQPLKPLKAAIEACIYLKSPQLPAARSAHITPAGQLHDGAGQRFLKSLLKPSTDSVGRFISNPAQVNDGIGMTSTEQVSAADLILRDFVVAGKNIDEQKIV